MRMYYGTESVALVQEAAREASQNKCAGCRMGLLGVDFFEKFEFKYCSTRCIKLHQETFA